MKLTRSLTIFPAVILTTLSVFPLSVSFLFLGRKALINFLAYLPYLVIIILIFSCFLLLIKYSKKIEKRINYTKNFLLINSLSGLGLVLLTILIRYALIYYFPAPAASDSLLALQIAGKWILGPVLSPQHFFFQHWGIYALALSKVFSVFGNSIFVAKSISACAAAITAVVTYFVLLKTTRKFGTALAGGLLISLWPSYALYVNFLSGEHLFIMFFSLAVLALVFADEKYKSTNIHKYYLWVIFFSIALCLGNVFKEMTIITIPSSIFAFVYIIWSVKSPLQRKIGALALSVLILLGCSIFITFLSDSMVSYYAKGPVNHSKTGYFIATGLNLDTGGRYSINIADSYTQPLRKALSANALTDTVYKKTDSEILNTAISVASSNAQHLTKLFLTKMYTVWSNEDEINNWNYDSYTLTNSKPVNSSLQELKDKLQKFNIFSNAYFLFVILFSILAAISLLKNYKKRRPELIFLALVVVGFSFALLIIEVLTRYRSILFPALAILAVYGMVYLVDLGPGKKKSSN